MHARAFCGDCGSKLRGKGRHAVVFRTLFGNVPLDSPRLRHCACTAHDTASFSPLADLLPERSAPELRFMEAKWASLVSYGMTAKALQDFLPVDDAMNASTVRNHTLAVAQRCEAKLGEEQFAFVEGCPNDWNALPPAEGPITVGIDGGYLSQTDTPIHRDHPQCEEGPFWNSNLTLRAAILAEVHRRTQGT